MRKNSTKQNSGHPGVSIVVPKSGYVLEAMFHHPLLNKRVKRSFRTADRVQAAKFARELSAIISNPSAWRKLPECSPAVSAVWNGDAVDNVLMDAVAATQKPVTIGLAVISNKQRQANKDVQEQIDNLIAENSRLRDDAVISQKKIENLSALLKKMGHDAAADYAPKTPAQAVEDFLSDDKKLSGCNAGKRMKVTYRSWLTQFVKSVSDTDIHTISAKQVTDFLAGKFKEAEQKTVASMGGRIARFLEHQTAGTFRAMPVREWIKANCHDDDGKHANPLWLDEAQVSAMLAEMPEQFRAAALVQWAGAFRPEELAHIQTAKCYVNGDIRVEIDALFVDGELKWKPKTRRSYGRVHLPEFARETMRNLMEARANDFLLFPCPQSRHEKKIWSSGDAWTREYLPALRAGATAANAKGAAIDLDRLDSRTLRRSAGKRILLQSGYDLKLAAAVLRDLPTTVEKHYASIRPEDVKQPETKPAKKKK